MNGLTIRIGYLTTVFSRPTGMLLLGCHLLWGLSVSSAQKLSSYDVCVYGATAAGVIAAYTVVSKGKTVIIIEPGKHSGGMSSGGLGQTDIGNKIAITGLARSFYKRIGEHYGQQEQWTFEPHVAEDVFNDFLKEGRIEVLYKHRLAELKKRDRNITEIEVDTIDTRDRTVRKIIRAQIFIDCSYEGDLMAKAGVSYVVGRERNTLYGETWNGVQVLEKHQFPDNIDPYLEPGNPTSGLIWGISTDAVKEKGTGDHHVQAYNFRICLTKNGRNFIPISRPSDYDSIKYELLARQIAVTKPDSLNWQLMHIAPMPGQKTDINNCGGFSSDMIGGSDAYPEADYEKRQQIIKAHITYTKGWLYFLGHDLRVPEKLRNEMLQWGYPADEYPDNENFSPQLYIRECRRMISDYVMTQDNCTGKKVAADGIGLAAYTMDSHNCQRIVVNGMVKNEGDMQVGGFGPYPVSYRSIVPADKECSNLLVPVCLSASHIAYGSIRMEPVFMVLAQSAGTAACMAIDERKEVQRIDVEKLRRNLNFVK